MLESISIAPALDPRRIRRSDRRAGIAGLAASLPPTAVSNETVAAPIGVDPDWIVRRTGIVTRHRLMGQETLADLAIGAARRALEQAEVLAEDLDAVLVATSSADQIMPQAAPVIAHAIGAHRAMACDLGIACTGFLAGLQLGAGLIESGRSSRVLLVAADALSRMSDPHDRGTAALFGDGAGAVVLVAGGAWAISESFIVSDATDADALSIGAEERLIRMDGQLVFGRAIAAMEHACREVLDAAGLAAQDVTLVVPHQANARITAALTTRLGLDPDRVVSNIAAVGNTGAASIPLALADIDVPPASTVLLTAFGAGFASGALLLRTAA